MTPGVVMQRMAAIIPCYPKKKWALFNMGQTLRIDEHQCPNQSRSRTASIGPPSSTLASLKKRESDQFEE